ncbi:MAG: serine--tRNA ligase [Candidatus Aenigmarchaeota archaeon]|nr:serine--tRNA ligase [Candidatus Aenigmarchaeota archaeon]
MLDIKLVREFPESVRANIERRQDKDKLKLLDKVIKTDAKWRELTGEVNELRSKRNAISMEIAALKKAGKEKEAEAKVDEAAKIPKRIKLLDEKQIALADELRLGLMSLPNMLHESVPFGKDDHDNVEIRRVGKPPAFGFEPKDHVQILTALGLLDEERAAKVTGSGFVYLKGQLAMLDLAIQRFALEFLQKRGFTVVEPPFMMNRRAYEGVTDLGDFEKVMYKIEGDNLFLIATSEHPMGAMYLDEVLEKQQLPIRFAGISPCFRREVGAHGKYTKGLYRMHQFNKVEQFVFCLPEQSWEIHEEIQKNSEDLYQALGLHYRVVNVCTGDIGSIAAKKYDTEFWMADGEFREIGSNSNCTDYQARRLNVRWREAPSKPVQGFVHTLNNTALATSRTMLAIIEQNQQADGTVKIPEVLRPFMGGLEFIGKK